MTPSEIQMVVAATLKMLGVSACELTYAKACEHYGSWFVQACRRGDIRPVRTGRRTTWYAVADILAYEERERTLAHIQLESITTHNTHDNGKN